MAPENKSACPKCVNWEDQIPGNYSRRLVVGAILIFLFAFVQSLYLLHRHEDTGVHDPVGLGLFLLALSLMLIVSCTLAHFMDKYATLRHRYLFLDKKGNFHCHPIAPKWIPKLNNGKGAWLWEDDNDDPANWPEREISGLIFQICISAWNPNRHHNIWHNGKQTQDIDHSWKIMRAFWVPGVKGPLIELQSLDRYRTQPLYKANLVQDPLPALQFIAACSNVKDLSHFSFKYGEEVQKSVKLHDDLLVLTAKYNALVNQFDRILGQLNFFGFRIGSMLHILTSQRDRIDNSPIAAAISRYLYDPFNAVIPELPTQAWLEGNTNHSSLTPEAKTEMARISDKCIIRQFELPPTRKPRVRSGLEIETGVDPFSPAP